MSSKVKDPEEPMTMPMDQSSRSNSEPTHDEEPLSSQTKVKVNQGSSLRIKGSQFPEDEEDDRPVTKPCTSRGPFKSILKFLDPQSPIPPFANNQQNFNNLRHPNNHDNSNKNHKNDDHDHDPPNTCPTPRRKRTQSRIIPHQMSIYMSFWFMGFCLLIFSSSSSFERKITVQGAIPQQAQVSLMTESYGPDFIVTSTMGTVKPVVKRTSKSVTSSAASTSSTPIVTSTASTLSKVSMASASSSTGSGGGGGQSGGGGVNGNGNQIPSSTPTISSSGTRSSPLSPIPTSLSPSPPSPSSPSVSLGATLGHPPHLKQDKLGEPWREQMIEVPIKRGNSSVVTEVIPELRNETREALQEEGSHHQPVVFVGGPGYIPPSNLRPRPILEADSIWQNRPLPDGRYTVPLQSAWDRNYRNPFNMTRVQHIEAQCQDDFMKINVAFNGSFQGLIYSSGYSYDPDCVYVSGAGKDYYEYTIKLNRCGTLGASNHAEGRKEPSKNFMWNTVTVQYNPLIEEEFDEHFKVTCEYGYDFWKTVTFPFLDVEVATGNPVVFTLTPPECYMEVRYGFGATGTRVGGPVRVGDPLTLMIYMRSQYDGFDLVVNDCYAHNGATKKIQLIDHYGCPVDSKLMSPFRGTWSHTNVYETQVYAYLKTFRFTGSPALYIECDVRMCHGQCPSQPCYWRNVKNLQKRSVDDDHPLGIESIDPIPEESQVIGTGGVPLPSFLSTGPAPGDSSSSKERNGTLSENINLFQALRVLQEDEELSAFKSDVEAPENVCLKTGAFTALIGIGTLLLVILSMMSLVSCYRLKRMKHVSDGDNSEILRPYTHHVSHPPHHWSSSSINSSSTVSVAKPRLP